MPPSIRSCKPRERLTWMRAYMATCRHCRGEVHCHRNAESGDMDPAHCSCQRCGQTYSLDVTDATLWKAEQDAQRRALKALREHFAGKH